MSSKHHLRHCLCPVCTTRVAVGIQCAVCDHWYHANVKCAGTENHGRPPFVCVTCKSLLNPPTISHFAAQVEHRRAVWSDDTCGRKLGRMRSGSPQSPNLSLSFKELRHLQKSSQSASMSLQTPQITALVSALEYDSDLSASALETSSGSSASSTNDNHRQAGEKPGAKLLLKQDAYLQYHNRSSAPQANTAKKIQSAYKDSNGILQVFSAEDRNIIEETATALTSTFDETIEFGVAKFVQQDATLGDRSALGGANAAEVEMLLLVEQFNNNAFGHRLGEWERSEQEKRLKSMKLKLKEKKSTLKERTAQNTQLRKQKEETHVSRVAADARVVTAHRKMYFIGVPPPLARPANASSSDDGDSTQRRREPTFDAPITRSTANRSTQDLRVSAVEEVVAGFRASSDDEEGEGGETGQLDMSRLLIGRLDDKSFVERHQQMMHVMHAT